MSRKQIIETIELNWASCKINTQHLTKCVFVTDGPKPLATSELSTATHNNVKPQSFPFWQHCLALIYSFASQPASGSNCQLVKRWLIVLKSKQWENKVKRRSMQWENINLVSNMCYWSVAQWHACVAKMFVAKTKEEKSQDLYGNNMAVLCCSLVSLNP